LKELLEAQAMAVQLEQSNQEEHNFAQRVGRSVGRLVAKVTGSRTPQMARAGIAIQLDFAEEEKPQQPSHEKEPEVLIGMQPLTRRRVKVRIVNRKRLEPRFVYDPSDEELAIVG
jgi:hypothetical protein